MQLSHCLTSSNLGISTITLIKGKRKQINRIYDVFNDLFFVSCFIVEWSHLILLGPLQFRNFYCCFYSEETIQLLKELGQQNRTLVIIHLFHHSLCITIFTLNSLQSRGHFGGRREGWGIPLALQLQPAALFTTFPELSDLFLTADTSVEDQGIRQEMFSIEGGKY